MCILTIDKSDDKVNKYNKKYHGAIRMKPVDINLNRYIDCNKEKNKENPKVEIDDHVWILKYKNIFAKGFVPK